MNLWDAVKSGISMSNPLGAIATLGSSVISGISNNAAQKSANQANLEIANQNNQTAIDIADANRQAQIDMMRENNKFSREQAIEMFNLENAYNSPLEQVKRLKEAGINPAVYFGQGAGSAGSGDIATPSAAGSTISGSLPTLTTPHMEAAPPIVSGSIQAMAQLVNMSLAAAQAEKTGVETNEIQVMLTEKLRNLVAQTDNLEIKNQTENFQLQVEKMFQIAERDARLWKTVSEVQKIGVEAFELTQRGEKEAADKLVAQIEANLLKNKNKKLEAELPYTVSIIKANIDAIHARAQESRASASEHYARVEFTKQQAERIKEARPVLLEIDKLTRDDLSNKKYEFDQTIGDKIKMVTQQMQLQGKELERIDALIERAKKENNIFYLQQAIHMLREISDGVSNYVPAKGASSTPTSGYSIGYGLPDSTF